MPIRERDALRCPLSVGEHVDRIHPASADEALTAEDATHRTGGRARIVLMPTARYTNADITAGMRTTACPLCVRQGRFAAHGLGVGRSAAFGSAATAYPLTLAEVKSLGCRPSAVTGCDWLWSAPERARDRSLAPEGISSAMVRWWPAAHSIKTAAVPVLVVSPRFSRITSRDS